VEVWLVGACVAGWPGTVVDAEVPGVDFVAYRVGVLSGLEHAEISTAVATTAAIVPQVPLSLTVNTFRL
jgi:hypothetical protein